MLPFSCPPAKYQIIGIYEEGNDSGRVKRGIKTATLSPLSILSSSLEIKRIKRGLKKE